MCLQSRSSRRPPTTFAADYPDRAIKLIVPWAAGGDTDQIFRPLAPLLQKDLGQPIVIANVGGASGTVGEREASGAAPDGYTLFGAHDFIHSVYFAGDDRHQIRRGIRAGLHGLLDAVGDHRRRQDAMEDLQGAGRGRQEAPGQITVGASLGSTSQYSIALAGKAAGIKFKYVPYDGTAKRMNALLGGHIDVGDCNLTQKGKVDAGLLRFLANMSEKRTTGLEDVPTLKELGYNVVYAVNRGMMVPKGTPAAVIAKLNDACAKATKEPEFAKAMKLQGTDVDYLDPKGYAAYLKKTDVQTKDIAKDLGLLKRE